MRLRVAALLFAAAVFFAIRCSWPLRYGYFAPLGQKDDPDGLYITNAGVAAAIAVLFAALSLSVLSRRFREHGGLLALGFLALLVSLLPLALRLWGYEPATWSWPHVPASPFSLSLP